MICGVLFLKNPKKYKKIKIFKFNTINFNASIVQRHSKIKTTKTLEL